MIGGCGFFIESVVWLLIIQKNNNLVGAGPVKTVIARPMSAGTILWGWAVSSVGLGRAMPAPTRFWCEVAKNISDNLVFLRFS